MAKQYKKHMLGNYIYLKWENYKRAGTRNNWTRGENAEPLENNFNINIFKAHKVNILQSIQQLKVPNIKNLEQAYNDSLQKRLKQMEKIAATDTDSLEGMMEILISLLGKRYATQASTYAKQIKWDPIHDRPVIIGGITDLNLDTFPPPPPYTLHAQRGRGQCSPRIAFCIAMQKYILSVNNNQKNEDWNLLNRIIMDLESMRDSYRKIHNIISKEARAYELTNKQAKVFDNILNKIRGRYVSVAELNQKLWAAWAEFTGNILLSDLDYITWKEIYNAMQVGAKRTTASQGKTNTVSVKLDTAATEKYVKTKYKEALQKMSEQEQKQFVSKQIGILANFQALGSSVQNKRDIQATLLGQEYGISMKNTNLLAQAPIDIDEELSDHQIPHVSLQSSSLALYLMGIEEQQEALGTHYLNILAANAGDEDSVYKKMRTEANQALSLYILYSALTGEGQLRQQAKTNLFAIYDKAAKNGKHRVKLYDMADLILTIHGNKTVLEQSLLPSIDAINLDNVKIYVKKGESNNKAVAERVTRILLEARTTNIEARVTNQILQNIYINRYKT